MICLKRPYHIKVFKGCLPQIFIDQFLNTLSHIYPRQQKHIDKLLCVSLEFQFYFILKTETIWVWLIETIWSASYLEADLGLL